MARMRRINLYLSREMLVSIDKLVAAGKFASRTEFIRAAAREKLLLSAKKVTWHDLDEAALDALGEILRKLHTTKKAKKSR